VEFKIKPDTVRKLTLIRPAENLQPSLNHRRKNPITMNYYNQTEQEELFSETKTIRRLQNAGLTKMEFALVDSNLRLLLSVLLK